MPTLAPDHRFSAVRYLKAAPADPVDASGYELFQKGQTSDPVTQYAYELHDNSEHRAILDAFLLSMLDVSRISVVLGIPEDVLARYMYFFLDLDAFRNKLELISYASTYEGSSYGRELVRAAVTVGPSYLLWAFGDSTLDDLDTRFVIRSTMRDAYFRGLAHKGNALTTDVAKESQKWWLTAIKNAELLERIDPHTAKDAAKELQIALESHDETLKPEQSPVPLEDILH